MRKGLIGIMVLACVALISGTALAATFWSVDVEGTVEWTILDQTGLMPGIDADANTGPAFVIPELTITAGPWEAGTGADAEAEGYIKYTKADMGSITLNNVVSYDIFGLGADIQEAQGITLATEVAPLSLEAVYNMDGTTSAYGLGLEYDVGISTLGVAYNSTTAWGVQLVTGTDALDVTLTAGVNAASANAYGVGLAAGVISLDYSVSFDSVAVATEETEGYLYNLGGIWYWTEDTADIPADAYYMESVRVDVFELAGGPVSKLSAALTDLTLTENTKLTVEVVNQDIADADYAAGTTITATAVTALADAIDLTTKIASVPTPAIEYSAKIGVSF